MTEQQWLECADPEVMLRFLGERVSGEKLRLFMAACCHLQLGGRLEPHAEARVAEQAIQSELLRDLFGPLPFRPVALDPSWLAWNNGMVLALAQAAYEERSLPDGTLDNSRLAVLADALEEAGCADSDILAHCRQPGLHVRGCWVLNLLLAQDPAGETKDQTPNPEQGEVPGWVRFRPSRAEGLPDVREVVVRPDRLEVNTAGVWVTFPFRRIGRRQESRVAALVKRLIRRHPWPMLVADRDWFHPPRERFFLWYTNPPLRTCMPEDEPAEHATSYFLRIQMVLQSGGYATADLG